jgi:predicted nucleic acid-binding protein
VHEKRVVQEFFHVALRVPRGAAYSWPARCPLVDALIVAAALEAEWDAWYSEDLQHGRTFGKLKIQNPFIGL